MQSTSPHVSAPFLRVLGDNDVMVVAVPAHTRNIFQACDLVFCGALNKLMATAQGESGDDSASDVITKLVRGQQKTATSITVCGSFATAELVPDTSVPPLRLTIEEDKIRNNQASREASDGHIDMKEISRRRQDHRLRMTDQQFGME
jgi:hypothetical protein